MDDLPSRASPVSVLKSSLGVSLPASVHPKAFDRALNRRLKGVAIDRWGRQEAVRGSFWRTTSIPASPFAANTTGEI